MTLDEQERQDGQTFEDMIGLLQRIVRDAGRSTSLSTGRSVCTVPSPLLKEAQELLERHNPALVSHFRAF